MALGCRQSKPIPAEIVGDSMAPLLCGLHLRQSCPQCDFTFACRQGQDINSAQCPNCGSQFPVQTETQPADRVQVTPGNAPQRWDLIAFENNGSTMIKRVVGLPGETVSITGGNIIINQDVAVKPNSISAQTQYLVFDSDQRSQANSSKPWQLEFNADHWENEGGTFVHRQRGFPHESYDWISYRHQRNYPHFTKVTDETTETEWPAIQDNNSFNQNVSRKLNDVHELAVQLDLKVERGSKFKIQIRRPKRTYFVTFWVDLSSPQYEISFFNVKPAATAKRTFKSGGNGPFEFSLLFSNIDERIKVSVDGVILINELDSDFVDNLDRVDDKPDRFDSRAIPSKSSVPRLKFGFSGSSNGTVNRCRIWRDIHYFSDASPPKFELPMTLKQGEYFVLGDNVAVSRDSRHFGPIKRVIGIVQK